MTTSMPSSDITLYTCGTPNGIKISILLEELGLPYKLRTINFEKNEQKEEWFLKINPNGRIPAITDKIKVGGETKEINIFESGAIMLYLVERYDPEHKVSFARDDPEYWPMISWLMWQMAGLGPMQGQAHHFFRYGPEKAPYAFERYQNETRRLYKTMDTQLKNMGDKQQHKPQYLLGEKCTIADFACWGWVTSFRHAGIDDLQEYPYLKAWMYHLLARPGVEAGRHKPTRHTEIDFL